MKRHITYLHVIGIALIGADCAHAEPVLRHCRDLQARVTITDQACPPGHTMLALTAPHGAPEHGAEPKAEAAPATSLTLAPAQIALPWRTRTLPMPPPTMALAGDIATIKAARVRFLLARGASASLAAAD